MAKKVGSRSIKAAAKKRPRAAGPSKSAPGPSTSPRSPSPAPDSLSGAPPAARTPSLAASLGVFGVMIALILLSVVFFKDEVAAGPLQISITFATLVALGVALANGHRGSIITEAITHHINGALGSIFILLGIGAIIGALYLAGTVPAFVYYGVAIISPKFFYITVFVLSSILSILTGSSFTTVGAVGVAFVGLGSLMGVNTAVVAGAAVSGAFFGDKIARISDTFVLTTAVVGDVDADAHGRAVLQTGIPAWILSALLFGVLGFAGKSAGPGVDPAQVQGVLRGSFNISVLAFLPVILIFVLSSLRVSGFLTLMLAAIGGAILAAFTQPALITATAADPSLPYVQAALKVGIETFAKGFHLQSGNPGMDKLFSGGGTYAMLETIWLVLVASSFGAIADHTGMVGRVIAPVIRWAKSAGSLIVATVLTTMGLNALAADPYVSIVLSAQMYRKAYIDRRLEPVVLSTAIADGGSIFSPVIPWNVHGAFVGGALGIGALTFAPYAFLCYLQPLVTMILGIVRLRKQTLGENVDARGVYGRERPESKLPELQMTS